MKRIIELVGGMLGGKKTHAYYMEQGLKSLNNQDFIAADREYTKALELAEEARAHNDVAAISIQLGTIAELLDKLAVAETHYRRAYQTEEDSEHHEQSARMLVVLGRLYHRMRRLPDAEQVLQYAMSMYQQQLTAMHPGMAAAATCLADCYLARKSFAEAEKLLLRAISIDERDNGPTDLLVASGLHKLSICLDGQGKEIDAEQTFKRAIREYEKNEASFDKAMAHQACACYHDFGRFYLKHNRRSEAHAVLNKAMELAEKYAGYLDEADLAEKSQNLRD